VKKRAVTLVLSLTACQAVFGIESKELASTPADAGVDAGADVPLDAADDGYVPDPEPADCHVVDPKYGVSRFHVPNDGPDGTNYVIDDLVVTDKTTGLMWQRATKSGPFADAKCDCANLLLRGLTDWRMPSLAELVTIVDYAKNPDTMGTGTTSPTINLTAFPDTGIDGYWTTSIGTGMNILALEFIDGRVVEILDKGAGAASYRCVRTDARAPEPPSRFVIEGGTARDVLTGLTWARDVSPSPVTYAQGGGYCAALVVDGKGPFRLPTIKELVGLVDSRIKGTPKIDKTAFPKADKMYVAFSSTRYAADPTGQTWKVDLTNAEYFRGIQSDPVNVLCVK
jgi:hypothetical protein